MIAKCIEKVRVIHVIRDRITSSVVIINVEEQNFWVPINITSETHTWKCVALNICAWMHGKTWQSVANTERKNTTIHSLNAL